MQRFLPSEFGLDPDNTRVSQLDHNFYSKKSEIRRLVEAECIPYTYVSCNFYTSYLLPSLVQPGLQSPPRERVTIFGDGNVKGSLLSGIILSFNELSYRKQSLKKNKKKLCMFFFIGRSNFFFFLKVSL